LSGVPDVITHAKFYVNRSRGFSGCSSPKSAISYTYSNDPYNSSALPLAMSIHPSVTVMIHAQTVQHIEMPIAPSDRAMLDARFLSGS